MSHPSEYAKLRFCPKCGCDKIKRDYFNAEDGNTRGVKQRTVGVEFICELCGFGFWISKSRRVLLAERNFARERKRPNVKFEEKCVGTEVARAFLSHKEPPRFVSLKEKLLNKFGMSNKCKNCNHTAHSGKCNDGYGRCECLG